MSVISMATVHSVERMKERAGLNERKAYKMLELAVERGKTADDFTSWERDFLLSESKNDRTAIAYNNYCYIMGDNGFCITMFHLPSWFGKKKHFNGKERIRNFKAYSRYYCV